MPYSTACHRAGAPATYRSHLRWNVGRRKNVETNRRPNSSLANARNIAYAKPAATDAEIRAAAQKAHIENFILNLPEQYETLVGERGVKLSGGQRQRIAIARAFLKNAPILLLDEATSSVDSETEEMIQKSIEMMMKNRTSIVIAHRLSTIQKADKIIVLDKGEIKESGTHEELLALGGFYAKLHSMQFEKNKISLTV